MVVGREWEVVLEGKEVFLGRRRRKREGFKINEGSRVDAVIEIARQ